MIPRFKFGSTQPIVNTGFFMFLEKITSPGSKMREKGAQTGATLKK